MKTYLAVGALALALAGCADIEARTGITTAQQICVGTQAAAVAQAGDASADQIDAIATACGINLTAWAESLIGTALVTAVKAE
jgi:hypothetical protein